MRASDSHLKLVEPQDGQALQPVLPKGQCSSLNPIVGPAHSSCDASVSPRVITAARARGRQGLSLHHQASPRSSKSE